MTPKPLLFVSAAFLALTLAVTIGTHLASTSDARNDNRILAQLARDLNRGDVDAAMAHFAPDAVKVGGADCFPVACLTTEEIRAEWENQVAAGLHVRLIDHRRVRNVEFARAELTFDHLPNPLLTVVSATKRGDQFVTFSALRDPAGTDQRGRPSRSSD